MFRQPMSRAGWVRLSALLGAAACVWPAAWRLCSGSFRPGFRPVFRPDFRPGLGWLAVAASVLLFFGLFVHNFWAMSDLWLLARVADQFYAGHGPVWNEGEPVWVYTSVAWQWLMILVRGASWGAVPAYLYVLVLHALCLSAVLALVWLRWRSGFALLLMVLLFVGSNTLVDYSSGGLENSLGYVAVAAVWLLLGRGQRLHWTTLVFGLAVLVRFDLALLLGPAVVVALWRARGAGFGGWAWPAVLACLPAASWLTFAWFYYGSVVPSGYHARSAGFFGDLWPHYWDSYITFDLWAGVLLAAGVGVGLFRGGLVRPALCIGVVIYCVYVSMFLASQDVLLGRALTAAVFLALLLILERIQGYVVRGSWQRWAAVFGAVCFLLLFAPAFPPYHTPLFPAYSAWGEPYSTEDISFSWYLDARFGAQGLALRHVYRRDWEGVELEDRVSLRGESGVYVNTVGSAWLAAYYLPLGVVAVDGFHRHFRAGDAGVDVP